MKTGHSILEKRHACAALGHARRLRVEVKIPALLLERACREQCDGHRWQVIDCLMVQHYVVALRIQDCVHQRRHHLRIGSPNSRELQGSLDWQDERILVRRRKHGRPTVHQMQPRTLHYLGIDHVEVQRSFTMNPHKSIRILLQVGVKLKISVRFESHHRGQGMILWQLKHPQSGILKINLRQLFRQRIRQMTSIRDSSP